MTARKINKQDIIKAVQQLLGYRLARKDVGPEELVESMGMTEDEWLYIRDKCSDSAMLSDEEIKIINEYFERPRDEGARGDKE